MTIPLIEPTQFTRGDSLSWRRSLDDYRASDGWVLTYYIRGAATLDVTAGADGESHLIMLSSNDTDTLIAGEYHWAAKASRNAEVVTIATGQLTVLPDIADITAGHDARPHCKVMLDAIEAVLRGKASQDTLSYSIGGRSMTRMSFEQLEAVRDKYRNEWRVWKLREERKAGRRIHRKIQVRFTR